MEYQVQILSTAARDALLLLLALFAVQAFLLVLSQSSRASSMIARRDREYFKEHGEPLPRAIAEATTRPSLFRPLSLAFGISLGAGVIAFAMLAFTPLSYFPNFSTSRPAPSLELKALTVDLQSDPIHVDGEVTNTGTAAIDSLYVYLVLYDRTCTASDVRTIYLEKGLAPQQTLPFFFTEAKSEFVDKVGLTFSTRTQPLSHRESLEVRAASF